MYNQFRRIAVIISLATMVAIASAMGSGSDGNGLIITPQAQYKEEKKQIAADYALAKMHCLKLINSAKDICMAEARGSQRVALAELNVRYNGDETGQTVQLVKAEAAFHIAKEKCYDNASNLDEKCFKDAEATKEKAIAIAKLALKNKGNADPAASASNSPVIKVSTP